MESRVPFERLRSTHDSIERRLRTLEQATADLDEPSSRAEAQGALEDVAAYFDRGGARHIEDEEQSLFPRLRGVAELQPIIASLESEHREQERLHAKLCAALKMLGDGNTDAASLSRIVDELTGLYRRHTKREDEEFFPACARALSAEILEAIGVEMERRRGHRGQQHNQNSRGR